MEKSVEKPEVPAAGAVWLPDLHPDSHDGSHTQEVGMLRDMLSSKLVIAGLTGCLFLVAGSLFYQWHVERSIRKDEARTRRFLQQLENSETPRTPQPRETTDRDTEEQAAAPVATDDGSATVYDTPEHLPNAKAAREDTVAALEGTISKENTADIPVSPYGFGPYPELPAGWSTDTFPAPSADHELMARVEIKLLSQGINVTGSTMEDGKVYPAIKGTAYVTWKEYDTPAGTVRYISDILATGEDGRYLHAIRLEKGKSLTGEDIPPDIKLVPFEEGGIDPYEFLDLL